jgi:hypothetical protein
VSNATSLWLGLVFFLIGYSVHGVHDMVSSKKSQATLHGRHFSPRQDPKFPLASSFNVTYPATE